LQLGVNFLSNGLTMKKQTAIDLLGGNVATVARVLGCTRAAVYKWPDDRPLPRPIADRVLAARVRLRAEVMRQMGKDIDPTEADAVAL
jgi:pyruvate/2-oxoglutarate/acetoin dehydrogenase E1 component